MKLKFEQPYKSIGEEIQKDLENLDFPDFSIITGTNGSGKTHLLEAISKYDIISPVIDSDKMYRIALFNHETFRFHSTYFDNETKDMFYWRKVQREHFRAFQSMVNYVFHKIAESKGYPKDVKRLEGEGFTLKSPDFLEKDRQSIDDFADLLYEFIQMDLRQGDTIGLVENFVKKHFKSNQHSEVQNINNIINGFIADDHHSIIQSRSLLTEVIYETLRLTFTEQKTLKELKYLPYDIVDYGSFDVGPRGVQQKNLYLYSKTTLMGQEISRIFSDYIERKEAFISDNWDKKESKIEKGGEIVVNMIELGSKKFKELEDKFIKRYGDNPLKEFNDILRKIDCNEYVFKESSPDPLAHGLIKDPLKEHRSAKFNDRPSQSVDIQDLSSGEQILFGIATFVFGHKYRQRYNKKLAEKTGLILLLDEVDTNLHPSMIKELIEKIQDIFIKEYKLKVFLVTHSPTTIAVAEEYGVNDVFVMHRPGEKPRIEKVDTKEALKVLTEGYATLEEGLLLFEQISSKGKEVSIITEGHNVQYLQKALEFFGGKNKDKIDIIQGLESRTGVSQLKVLFQFFCIANHKNKVVFVFDCDAVGDKIQGYKDINNTYQYIFEQNNDSVPERGIENLFASSLFTKHKSLKSPEDKDRFRKHIMQRNNKEDFINFKPLFDRIDDIINDK